MERAPAIKLLGIPHIRALSLILRDVQLRQPHRIILCRAASAGRPRRFISITALTAAAPCAAWPQKRCTDDTISIFDPNRENRAKEKSWPDAACRRAGRWGINLDSHSPPPCSTAGRRAMGRLHLPTTNDHFLASGISLARDCWQPPQCRSSP